MVRAPLRHATSATAGADGASRSHRMADLPDDRWARAVLDLVRVQAAAALGHGEEAEADGGRAFREPGFDLILDNVI
ncbi:acyl carrier protein [Kitasatospora sp. NPDC058263]